MKPVIFVDIDDVMCDSWSWWVTLYNKEHGTSYVKDDFTEWKADFLEHPIEVYFHNYDKVEPIKGAFGHVGILQKKYRIVFATAGHGWEWMKFFMPNAEIIYIQDKSLLRGFALIDDKPLNLDGFIGLRYLYRQPWNTNRGLNDATWEDITKHLMEVDIETIRFAD